MMVPLLTHENWIGSIPVNESGDGSNNSYNLLETSAGGALAVIAARFLRELNYAHVNS